jgi:hypothetical protein
MIASGPRLPMYLTSVTPRKLFNFPAGTIIGPALGALPGGVGGSGRGRGVEGDVALDLLHHLVDVSAQHGDRSEALEIRKRLGAVLGAPAPLRIDHPQGNVSEDDDGCRR